MAELDAGTSADKIRETVRARYADAATLGRGCGCGCSDTDSEADDADLFGAKLYDASSRADAGQALELSLGCGTASAESTCCGTEVALTDESGNQVFGKALYEEADVDGTPAPAVQA